MSVRRTYINPPGKFMSVRRTDGPSWKIIKRLLLEKKNRYFRKMSRWLLLIAISKNVPDFSLISLFWQKPRYWCGMPKINFFFRIIIIIAVCPAALAGRERFIIIIYNITHFPKRHPSPTPSFLRNHIIKTAQNEIFRHEKVGMF